MESTFDSLEIMVTVFLGVFAALAYFAIWLKRRRQKRQYLEQGETAVGSLEDLRRAEEAMTGGAMQVRENLLQTHALIGRFPTMRGYSQATMDTLVKKLEEQNISSQILFQETLPVGVASAIEAQGVFELYAPYAQAEEAQRIISGAQD